MENRITKKSFILINKPGDPDTFYSRTWRTTRTPDLAIATDDIQGITEREVLSQLAGSDHRLVIISIKSQTQSHRNKLPTSWNYKKPTVMLLERRWTGKLQNWNCRKPTSATVLLFSAWLFLKLQWYSSQEESAETTSPTGMQNLTTLHKALDQAREKMESSPTIQLSNKRKRRTTQNKGSAQKGKNTRLDE